MKQRSATRAASFNTTRDQHRSEAAEDYTELIAELIESVGEARTCTIAEHLGISHVTALRTMRRLVKEGYLITRPHQPIQLTLKGQRLAAASRQRHTLVVAFLRALGASKATSERDAEGIEHHLSQETLRLIERWLNTQQSNKQP